jgi:hypothetical protein
VRVVVRQRQFDGRLGRWDRARRERGIQLRTGSEQWRQRFHRFEWEHKPFERQFQWLERHLDRVARWRKHERFERQFQRFGGELQRFNRQFGLER